MSLGQQGESSAALAHHSEPSDRRSQFQHVRTDNHSTKHPGQRRALENPSVFPSGSMTDSQ